MLSGGSILMVMYIMMFRTVALIISSTKARAQGEVAQ
jgi:hypothetical protein